MKFPHTHSSKRTIRLWLLCAVLSPIATQVSAQPSIGAFQYTAATPPPTAPPTYMNDCGQLTTVRSFQVFQPGVPAPIVGPWPFGPGTVPQVAATYDDNQAYLGSVLWWHYPQPAAPSGWGQIMLVGSASILTPPYLKQLADEVYNATLGPNPLAQLSTVIGVRIGLPLSDPVLARVWCPQWGTIVASVPPPPTSPDGAAIPPLNTIIDAAKTRWTILNGWAARNGVITNGHATEILYKGGAIYVKSPTGGIWWKFIGPGNLWYKQTTTPP